MGGRVSGDYEDVVFFAADAAYLQIAWIAAHRAAAEPGRCFDVVIFTTLRDIAPPPGCKIVEVALPEPFRSLPTPAHLSPFCFARLVAPDFWLGRYRRALYLDSDVRLIGALAPLFKLDMRGATLAMAEDCGVFLRDPMAAAEFEIYRVSLGQDPQATYFNSGVILFDLPAWRAGQYWLRSLAFIEARNAPLIFLDQDILNTICAGKILELSPEWNFPTHYFGAPLDDLLCPKILHFVDILKPWRDPEWIDLHGPTEPAAFAQSLANSPWRTNRLSRFFRWLGSIFYSRTNAPRLNRQSIINHLTHFETQSATLAVTIRAGIAARLRTGRYADTNPAAEFKNPA